MQFKIATLMFIGLSTFTLSACSSAPAKTAEAAKPVVIEPAKPTISAEAQQALTKAEADAKDAKAKFALWTTAETALKAAQDAAKTGDSAVVIKNASFVSSQVAHGIAQLAYPTTEQK